MRYFFILVLLLKIFILPCGNCMAENHQSLSVYQTGEENIVIIKLDDLFSGECLSAEGKEILFELKNKIREDKVFIECYTNRKGGYCAEWELADIYAYKIARFLILCCKIKAEKINYIGYGNISGYNSESNRVEFNLLKE